MSKHTPGPWYVNTAGSAHRGEPIKITEFFVYAPDTQDDTAICADVIDPVTQDPSEANARLIAAAPEMLAALKLCKKYISGFNVDHPSFYGEWLDIVRAAIAKAEMEATCKYGNITAECTTTPMDCQCAIDAALAP